MGKNRDLRGAAIAGLIISILATIFSIGVIVYAVINVSKTLSNAGKELLTTVVSHLILMTLILIPIQMIVMTMMTVITAMAMTKKFL